MKANVDVLMDRAPAEAEAAALAAIGELSPAVELRRLRMRQAGGRQFADVVIGVSPSAAVGQGHAAADAVEAAVERALPNADVVVHVEPIEDAALRERAHAAALARAARARGAQPRARRRRRPDGAVAAREAARRAVARRGARDCRAARGARSAPRCRRSRACRRTSSRSPRRTDGAARWKRHGAALVRAHRRRGDRHGAAGAALPAHDARARRLPHARASTARSRLDEAHARASEIEERIRRERPDIADVIVHTEP